MYYLQGEKACFCKFGKSHERRFLLYISYMFLDYRDFFGFFFIVNFSYLFQNLKTIMNLRENNINQKLNGFLKR